MADRCWRRTSLTRCWCGGRRNSFLGEPLRWRQTRCTFLSLPDSLDLLTTAFGFRNLANYRAGLEEFYRTLKPGGELGILDFSEPGGFMGKLYALYFRRVLPAVGSLISGVSGPYRYLPVPCSRFPAPAELMQTMKSVGFAQVSWTPYNFGIAGLYRGVKTLTM